VSHPTPNHECLSAVFVSLPQLRYKRPGARNRLPAQLTCTFNNTMSFLPPRLVNDDRISAAAAQKVGASAASAYTWRVRRSLLYIILPFANTELKPPSPPHIHIPPTSEDKLVCLPEYIGFANQKDRDVLQHILQGNFYVEVFKMKDFEHCLSQVCRVY
jgi:hypothetical protein